MDTIREMMDYVGFGAADGEALQALLPFADPVLPMIADRFYEAIDRSPGARRVFVNDAQIQRLKVSMQIWLRQLLEGPWDTAYWERRRSIGRTHVRGGPARALHVHRHEPPARGARGHRPQEPPRRARLGHLPRRRPGV
ncbi:MAG: protoglobin family protein [Deltaproteobacteria bacterium]|nr:protoglobin family protein [Deltaproteobacteria bacterium]